MLVHVNDDKIAAMTNTDSGDDDKSQKKKNCSSRHLIFITKQ